MKLRLTLSSIPASSSAQYFKLENSDTYINSSDNTDYLFMGIIGYELVSDSYPLTKTISKSSTIVVISDNSVTDLVNFLNNPQWFMLVRTPDTDSSGNSVCYVVPMCVGVALGEYSGDNEISISVNHWVRSIKTLKQFTFLLNNNGVISQVDPVSIVSHNTNEISDYNPKIYNSIYTLIFTLSETDIADNSIVLVSVIPRNNIIDQISNFALPSALQKANTTSFLEKL